MKHAVGTIEIDPDRLTARLVGEWTTPVVASLAGELERTRWPTTGEIALSGGRLVALDTAGAWLIGRLLEDLKDRGCTPRLTELAPRHRAVLELVQAQMAAHPAPGATAPGFLESIGRASVAQSREAYALAAFIGETAIGLLRSVLRPGRIRYASLLTHIEEAGLNALPIVGLLAFLIGVVISYQGGVQLRSYGANIFIVELVTLTTVRELGPLLAAIIVAGRTGSAYAAQIASMQVSEEIDALRAMGADPLELLVIPRVLALVVVLPLLAVFSDLMAVLGGMVMASAILDVGMRDFAQRIPEAISLTSFTIGIAKTPVFAVTLALVGCFQGFQAERSADSVGARTTLSVVEGIFLVIVADAMFSVVFSWLGI
jgi:phospholipid/cholesterol/gamma-HCH transport system permease protein